MPPKQLTPEQDADKKLAESLRAPLSFNIAKPSFSYSNSTPAITATPQQQRPASPSIFTDIGNVVKDTTKKLGVFDYSNPDLGKPLTFDKEKMQKVQEIALNFTPMGMAKATGQIIAKETKPVFKGLKDLSTSIVEKLKGRTTVSKQFISDLTKGADVKLPEKNIINNVLESSPDNISVTDFAKKVQDELLPLKISSSNLKRPAQITKGISSSEKDFSGEFSPLYEGISLPDELRGNVADYSEHIFESPIKTSAGNVHFGGSRKIGGTENYFGHTRIEDMADNQTRRVIEVQSDLYQKGNLEREKSTRAFITKEIDADYNVLAKRIEALTKRDDLTQLQRQQEISKAKKLQEELVKKANEPAEIARKKEVSKLEQYNDPTAHFRMIREEIKKAAEDGKSKLQFPTGETAMKIEGLGERNTWTLPENFDFSPGPTTPSLQVSDLKIGREINEGMGGHRWIITDILGDGKFKAVPKRLSGTAESMNKYIESGQFNELENFKETFDISGKVDQNNPIYKFYDKEVRKFLNKFGGKEIVDDKGVSWIEIPITKEQATQPVQAFGKIGIKSLLAGAGATGLFTAITNTGSKTSYERKEPEYTPQQIREAIAINETQGVENPYSFHKFSGSIKMGEDLGKYQVTTENLRLYGERYLGKKVSVKEFLASPKLQDKYAEGFISEMQTKYNATPEQILEMWRGGLNVNPEKSNIKQYREKGMKNLETMLQSNNQTS